VVAWNFDGINDRFDSDWHRGPKAAFNAELLKRVYAAQAEQKIDIFFGYLSGRQVTADTIQAIGELGIITVNISLDDTTKFWGFDEPAGHSGIAPIAAAFDICITTQATQDVAKYLSVEANPLFLPPGGNPRAFSFTEIARDIPISFVGQAYGARLPIVKALRSAGIPIQTFGKGWPGGAISQAEMQTIYSRSLINLGFGYIGGDTALIGLKGRDFEVPLTGGLYLTTYNPDLAEYLEPGRQIDCYTSIEEMIDKINYYLAHPAQAMTIGRAGREEVLARHTWRHRFETLLNVASAKDSRR
ncbi:MAG: glycosyltransferase, partial [Caldilineaceae bacterium]|nr:glycosyltransferase [Caldilineaceae bacterium]